MCKREAYLTLEKNYDIIDGHKRMYVDSFGIAIKKGRTCYVLDGLDIDNKQEFITFLAEARDKKLKTVRLTAGQCGYNEVIDIPRWAYQELINQMWLYL